ncbi:MAG TPA: MerR family transcriptional regulator [Actinomycetota bacterium]
MGDTATGSLRIGELARRTGVSPELLRAWEQRYGVLRPSRTAGGFRLYSERDAARVLRMRELMSRGLAAAEAARRVLADASEPPTPAEAAPDESLLEDLSRRLGAVLDRFDGAAAHAVLDELLGAVSVETAIREVILRYLATLGDRWARGEASVAQEHFASNLIRGRLLGLARGWGAGPGPDVVLACPPGEEHDLGLIAFGILVARRGWRVTYLGADTPFETLEDAVASVRPAVVVLAVSDPELLRPHAGTVRRLAASVPVAIGGVVDGLDAAALGARLLDTDVATAARTLTA